MEATVGDWSAAVTALCSLEMRAGSSSIELCSVAAGDWHWQGLVSGQVLWAMRSKGTKERDTFQLQLVAWYTTTGPAYSIAGGRGRRTEK